MMNIEVESRLCEYSTMNTTSNTSDELTSISFLYLRSYKPAIHIFIFSRLTYFVLVCFVIYLAPAYWVIKHTFFKHFCAGETIESGVSAAKELKKLVLFFHSLSPFFVLSLSLFMCMCCECTFIELKMLSFFSLD
jgi:hypothetical protein